MGAWGGFMAIDTKTYFQDVIPNFLKPQRSSMIREAIAELIKACKDGFDPLADFEFLKPKFSEDLIECDFPKRKAKEYEDLALLFEYLVTKHCCKYFTHFGLSINHLNLFLDTDSSDGKLILKQISDMKSYWIHGSGGFSEGIHFLLHNKDINKFLNGLRVNECYLEDADRRDQYLEKFEEIKSMMQFANQNQLSLIWGSDLNVFYCVDWRKRHFGEIIPFDQNQYVQYITTGYSY